MEALTLLGKERFSKNHDQILKRFLKSLRSEVDDILHLQIVRLLRYPSSRGQITESILRLCIPSPDPDALRSRQEFLDQKESRDEILNRFLQDQAIDRHDTNDRHNQLENEANNETSEDGDEGTSEDVEDENGPIRFEQLQTVISFLTKGSSYEDLKSNLNLLVHPPTSIPDAIQLGGVRSLRKLLEKRFNEIAIGEYAWINELREAGYSYYEIADLLYQDETDAPWIYFELEDHNPLELYPKDGEHVKNCAHCCFDDATTLDELQTQSFCLEESTGSEEIQKLCGLAGIIPVSRDPGEWNGAVTFKDENSVAVISYAKFRENGEIDTREVLNRITTVLDWACVAAGHMQASGLCCDSFTVIVHRTHGSELDEGVTPVSLCRINFISALQMLDRLKSMSSCDNITQSKLANVLRLLHEILDPIF